VDCDNVSGAADATRHLLRLGHSRIAFIAGTEQSSNACDRRLGYERALGEAGITPEPCMIVPGRFEEQGGREAMRALLARKPRPTAVFAANDMMAIGAMKVIRREGLRVPEDIAVVGFDDIPVAQYIEPSLTTVHQPIYQVGRRAAETLAMRLSDGPEGPDDMTSATRHILRTRLVIRESCGGRHA
jgi:DNA-binding LacI/PurR family transcriptional regulator